MHVRYTLPPLLAQDPAGFAWASEHYTSDVPNEVVFRKPQTSKAWDERAGHVLQHLQEQYPDAERITVLDPWGVPLTGFRKA